MNLSSVFSFGQLRQHRFLGYAASLLGVGMATLLTHLMPPLHEAPTDLFFAVIAGIAWWCGRGPAVLAIILSTLAVDYFIIPPIFSILFDIADVTRFLIFAFVALLICYLQERYQRIANRLQEANNVLETRVQQRTADLAAANQLLVGEIQERKTAAAALIESDARLRLALGGMEISLKEKEILIRELNHRVKNNLQIITSLLSLEGSRISDQASREVFKECQHRIRAIAMVHQRLCGSANLTKIDLNDYFRQLIRELFRSYYGGGGLVTPTVVVDETSLNIDHLIPCALIVNELVCNAFKYAFPAGQSGEVRVEIHRTDGNVMLHVADDGVGFSPDDVPPRNQIGLAIVQALVDQLSGKLESGAGQGTSATVIFPDQEQMGDDCNVLSSNTCG